jgi:serine/threonine protein kinase
VIRQTIAHYQILEKLGEGGMGVVYKARDTHLDRFVAIKVLPPDKVADPERKRRFVHTAGLSRLQDITDIWWVMCTDSSLRATCGPLLTRGGLSRTTR